MKYGLIGKTLGYSYSPQIHKELGIDGYEKIQLSESELKEFFSKKDFVGLNVTIPFKEKVLKYLDEIEKNAAEIGSVNTVFNDGGKLIGYNTDYFGLKYCIEKLGVPLEGLTVCVLGSGGASKCAVKLAKDLSAKKVSVVSRNGEINYQTLKEQKDVEFIINATPVGMNETFGECLVDLSDFPKLKGVVDLIYNPNITELLFRAKTLGVPCINGLSMLVAQAKKSEEIWLKKSIRESEIERIEKKLNKSVKNVVLIGMPGCGKSSVGKEIAKILGREFIDTDEQFQKTFNTSPAQCIKAEGENSFREKESSVIKTVSRESGKVIATGGGAPIKEINRKNLMSNGTIVYLERDINSLATDNRPLSEGKDGVKELFKKRKAIYESFCDVKIDANASIIKTANSVIETLCLGIKNEN